MSDRNSSFRGLGKILSSGKPAPSNSETKEKMFLKRKEMRMDLVLFNLEIDHPPDPIHKQKISLRVIPSDNPVGYNIPSVITLERRTNNGIGSPY